MKPLVIGLTGPQGAGRTLVARHIEDRGFRYVSLSDFLREQAAASAGIGELQDAGTNLRNQKGADVLAVMALRAAGDGQNLVVDGIKNPAEARRFAEASDFYLVAVESSPDTRFDRIGEERYGGQRTPFDDNDERDKEERDEAGKAVGFGQQVAECVRRADAMVWNDWPLQHLPNAGEASGSNEGALPRQDGSRDTLLTKVDAILDAILNPGMLRPQPHEVRMCQAYTVAYRSSCLRRKVGAVITNAEGYTVAEGYNEVPIGARSCADEHGDCYRRSVRERFIGSLVKNARCAACGGEFDERLRCVQCRARAVEVDLYERDLELCRAIHAEEGAILQFSRFGGVGIRGGTIFTTTFPCALCAKKILETELACVMYVEPYPAPESLAFFRHRSIELRHFEGFTHLGYHRVYPQPWASSPPQGGATDGPVP